MKFFFCIYFVGFLTFINCYDVKFTTKLQNVFMFTKIAALVIVIIVGIVWMAYGECMKWNEETIKLLFSGIFHHQVTWRTLKNHLIILRPIQANCQLHFIREFFRTLDGRLLCEYLV